MYKASNNTNFVNDKVLDSIESSIDMNSEELFQLLEIPSSEDFGDYSIPCFKLAKVMKKSPKVIASEISSSLQKNPWIDRVEEVNGYVNIFINRVKYSHQTLEQTLSGTVLNELRTLGEGKKVVLEFSSPNIAKEFGIGHLRSSIIGNALSNLYSNCGFETIKINYLGDWGTQFGKLIYGFMRYGDEKKLEKEPIKHLHDIYVETNLKMTDSGELESKKIFKDLEEGDKNALKLWVKFREFSLKEFMKVYDLLGIKFDKIEGESKYKDSVNDIVKALENKNLLVTSDDAQGVDLQNYNLGFVLVRKNDGTSIYASRDIAAAIDRHERFKFNKMIYEVGAEQSLHFNQLFKVLGLLGYEWHNSLEHVKHGLYLGPDGKKLSTRKGTSVNFMSIWNEVRYSVKQIYLSDKKEVDDKTLDTITRSAIIYADLKNYRVNDVIFNPESMTSFQGNTGPYLLYSYARANSILEKLVESMDERLLEVIPNNEEYQLLRAIGRFPQSLQLGLLDNDPSKIAVYAYDLCKQFNYFYGHCPVIDDPKQNYRVSIIKAFKKNLSASLNILGIETLDHM